MSEQNNSSPNDNDPQGIKREEQLLTRFDSFPSEIQGFISEISSMLLEPDIANQFKADGVEVIDIVKKYLKDGGLQESDIALVLDYFELKTTESQTVKQ